MRPRFVVPILFFLLVQNASNSQRRVSHLGTPDVVVLEDVMAVGNNTLTPTLGNVEVVMDTIFQLESTEFQTNPTLGIIS